MRRPPTCSIVGGNSFNVTMYDKSRNNATNHNNSARPLPAQSATHKPAKTPSTPRLAGSAVSSASPNIIRRGAQQENTATSKGSARDDISTPVKAFLSSNITPRSSSRNSRVSTTTPNTTPDVTPSNRRPISTIKPKHAISDEHNGGAGLGISGRDASISRRPRSIVTDNPGSALSPLSRSPESTCPRNLLPESSPAGFESTPKFFHANEAKLYASPRSSQQRPPSPTKSSSFVYASGADHEIDHETSAARSSVGLPAAQEARIQAKFFPANNIPDKKSKSSPKAFNPTKPTLATIPSSQEVPSTQALSSHQHALLQHEHSPFPRKSTTISRSSSLTKKPSPTASQTASPTDRQRSASNTSQPRNQITGTPQRQSSLKGSSRRSSVDQTSPRRLAHSKSASVGSLDTFSSANFTPRLRATASPSPLTVSNVAALDRGSTGNLFCKSPSIVQSTLHSPPHSPTQSPTKSTSTSQNLQQLNELAANARRERKVLDLEISNSSLLAINKTLERELSKQSAELRRFRRLSRSGRLSIATTNGETVGDLSALAESDDGAELCDVADEDEEGGAQPDPYNGVNNTMNDGLVSSANPFDAKSSRQHLVREEERLQLDLSKHQDLLVDSQRMNQSIKRCLGWSEELIKEGKKALEYRVQVEDIEYLDGRVLPPEDTPPDDRDVADDDAGILDDDGDVIDPVGPLTSESELASMSWDSQSPKNSMNSEKDSGVELETGEHPLKEGFARARDLVFRHLRETL